MTAAPYFPWATILVFAVIALLLGRFAHKQAHQRRNQMQVVFFQEHFDLTSSECYRRIKSMSSETLQQLDITIALDGESEVVHFARVPGRKQHDNYEILYHHGRAVHVRSRYGGSLEVCSGKVHDMLSVVMKLHGVLCDYSARNPPGPE